MKKVNECKVVQELLPNYIDNITTPEVTEYVKEHLNNCKECSKVRDNMLGKFEEEIKEDDKKVDYLKKIKRRLLLVIACLVLIIIGTLGNFIYTNYENFMFNMPATWKYTHIVTIRNEYNYTLKDGSTIDYITVYTMNKNGKCIDTRTSVDNLPSKAIEEVSNSFSRNKSDITNVQITEKRITFNTDNYNGMTKEEIINKLTGNNDRIIEI